MWPNPQETADLVTFTEEILNGKLRFLYSASKHLRWELCNNSLIYFLLKLCCSIFKLFISTIWWLVSKECLAYKGTIQNALKQLRRSFFGKIVNSWKHKPTISAKVLCLMFDMVLDMPLYAEHSCDTNHQVVTIKSFKILWQSFKRK